MLNDLQSAFKEIADNRMLDQSVIIEALQNALVSAYRKYSNASSAQAIEARVDPNSGRIHIYVEKEVVEEVDSTRFNTEVSLEDARFYQPECELGDVVMVQVTEQTSKFGRIAAQTAKQVILQRIREAERVNRYQEFIGHEGDLMTGTVQSVNQSMITLTLSGRVEAEAVMRKNQQIPGEKFRQHEKLRVLVLEVKNSNKGPQIEVSRADRNMLRRLLEYEVPEIYNGQVEIKNIAREAGQRSKVAVAALQDGVDPVGACVGMRGIRIQNIVKELNDEKIDVIEWSSDPKAFISKALSPSRVAGVYLDDDPDLGRTAVVIVPDEHLSLAIGKEGQNARLAAKLTGWRIDIKSVFETITEGLEMIDSEALVGLKTTMGPQLEEAERVLRKKEANLTIMPEEYRILDIVADAFESRLQQSREQDRNARRAEIIAVRSTIPQELFDMPVEALGLTEENINATLQSFGSAGDVMLASLTDLGKLGRKLSSEDLLLVQNALDDLLVIAIEDDLVSDTVTEEVSAEETIPEVEEIVEETDSLEPADLNEDATDEEDVVIADAFGGTFDKSDLSAESTVMSDTLEKEDTETIVYEEDDKEFDLEELQREKKKNKKSRQKRRQLVFDEDSGQTISKHRRKRGQDQWDDF